MKLKLNFIFICLVFSSSSWSIPTEYSATYSVKLKQADGLLTTKLSKQGELYSYEMITQATGIWKVISGGSVIERSTFKIEDTILKTEEYHLIDNIRRKPRESKAIFSWSRNNVSGFYKDREFKIDLDKNTLSRIILQLQIMHAKERQIEMNSFSVLDKDELKNIIIIKEENIKEANVPYGKYKAIKISHQTKDSERINSLWLAPELNFIPIKLTQTENGKTNFEANLTQLNY